METSSMVFRGASSTDEKQMENEVELGGICCQEKATEIGTSACSPDANVGECEDFVPVPSFGRGGCSFLENERAAERVVEGMEQRVRSGKEIVMLTDMHIDKQQRGVHGSDGNEAGLQDTCIERVNGKDCVAVKILNEKIETFGAESRNGETGNDQVMLANVELQALLKVEKDTTVCKTVEGKRECEGDGDVSLVNKARKVDEIQNPASALVHNAGVNEEGSQNRTENACIPFAPRYKKRKIALVLAYCGAGYQGMQKNEGAKTIEGDLEEALFRAGGIADSNFGTYKKIDWMRAARTDKGVSAVGQVVSGRFFIDPPGFVERVNAHLPDKIRLLGFKRVTGSFSAKNLCDRRRYEYVLPTFAFDPCNKYLATGNGNEDSAKNSHITSGSVEENIDNGLPVDMSMEDSKVQNTDTSLNQANLNVNDLTYEQNNDTGDDNNQYCYNHTEECSFNFGPAERNRLNDILKQYIGTHNFHNFTSRIKPEDPSAMRYIISFEASDAFKIGDMEFVKCTVLGQSFVLHQIRKMIGLAIAIMRGCVPETIIHKAFRRDEKVNVPLAPELGLFLQECLYSAYNNRWSGTHEEISLKDYQQEVQNFKTHYIYSHIASTEAKEGVVARWLQLLNDEKFPEFLAERRKQNA